MSIPAGVVTEESKEKVSGEVGTNVNVKESVLDMVSRGIKSGALEYKVYVSCVVIVGR